MEVVVANDYNDYDSMNNIDLLEHVSNRLRRGDDLFRGRLLAALGGNGSHGPLQPPVATELDEAKAIMGWSCIDPIEASKKLGIYGFLGMPGRVRSTLAQVPFSRDTLRSCAQSHVLLPSFPRVTVDWLVTHDHLGFVKRPEPKARRRAYVRKDALANIGRWGWHLVRRGGSEYPGKKEWSEAACSTPNGEYVMNAAEASYVSAIARLVFGDLFYTNHVLCCDVDGNNVCLYCDRGIMWATTVNNIGSWANKLRIATGVTPITS